MEQLRVLVACEFSGIVRDAFTSIGCDAMSCDLLPTEKEGNHYEGDVFNIINDGWDLMIAHPPCTHLAISGRAWFKYKSELQEESLDFVQTLMDARIPHICIENPISIISTRIRKPDQIIHPYQYGHGETKSTCLWLKNLPLLVPTKLMSGREQRIQNEPPSPERWKNRSRFYQGFADAMANQWGKLLQVQLNFFELNKE